MNPAITVVNVAEVESGAKKEKAFGGQNPLQWNVYDL
jgi:hypothetical protein